MLEREWLLRHPLLSDRFEPICMQHSPQHTMSEFNSLLRQAGINAQLYNLNANSFIVFYALSSLREQDQQIREDTLKLLPEKFTLKELMGLARSYATAIGSQR